MSFEEKIKLIWKCIHRKDHIAFDYTSKNNKYFFVSDFQPTNIERNRYIYGLDSRKAWGENVYVVDGMESIEVVEQK